MPRVRRFPPVDATRPSDRVHLVLEAAPEDPTDLHKQLLKVTLYEDSTIDHIMNTCPSLVLARIPQKRADETVRMIEEAGGEVTVRPAGSWEKSEIFSSGEPMEIEMVLETVDLMVAEMIAPSNKRTAIRSSLREALGNAVKWGHEGDESKMLDIMYLREGKTITITVSDKGSGFDPSPHLERPYDEEELKKAAEERAEEGGEGGLGILMIRSLADTVSYNDTGNTLTFSLHL